MSSVVSKIKEKVHRRSASLNHEEAVVSRAGTEWDDLTTRPLTAQGPTRISLENSAFHVHRAGGVRTSFEKSFDPTLHRPNNVDDSHDIRSRTLAEQSIPMSGDGIPDRASSKRAVAASRAEAQAKRTSRQEQDATEDLVPQRVSSKQVGYPADLGQGDQIIASNGTGSEAMNTVLPVRIASQQPAQRALGDKRRSIPLRRSSNPHQHVEYPNTVFNHGRDSPDEIAGKYHSKTKLPAKGITSGRDAQRAETRNGNRAVESNVGELLDSTNTQHLRLPAGFSVQNTEWTDVTETHKPAVTHETIIKQRTEILQEAIERDIHVHHYYTYLQPVKVVEVLPAKHYAFDPDTGIKTEIPAPSGWKMPASMAPTSPNVSTIKGWTRHYLVDENHPHGILENQVFEENASS